VEVGPPVEPRRRTGPLAVAELADAARDAIQRIVDEASPPSWLVPGEVRRMAFAWAADGTRLHYQVLGRPGADPLLMIQGLGTDMSGWTLQRLAFSPRFRTHD